LDPATRPLGKGDSDLVLQTFDLLRQCRLGDVLARRSAGEAALVRERHQISQLANLHSASL
jgi:hypothetical protein